MKCKGLPRLSQLLMGHPLQSPSPSPSSRADDFPQGSDERLGLG
jgi:hypothetical protein